MGEELLVAAGQKFGEVALGPAAAPAPPPARSAGSLLPVGARPRLEELRH